MNAVERVVINDFKWIFREQHIVDVGIDAHIEIVDESGNPTGRIIGVQIKTGLGNFTNKTDKLVYYGSEYHFDYWLSHSLPVILIAHVPGEDKTYWVLVDRTNAIKTEKGWKIEILKSSLFTKESREMLLDISKGRPDEYKLRRLLFDKEMIKRINDGNNLYIEAENWHNKSLGRSKIQVLYEDSDSITIEREWDIVFLGKTLEEALSEVFPWADIDIDHNYYDLNFEEENVKAFYWIEEGQIYPYDVLSGEVGQYRLKVELNEVGSAFVTIIDYLEF